MVDMDKLWKEVDTLKECRIRHDVRLSRIESDHKETMKHINRVETNIAEMRDEIRAGFANVSLRIDDYEKEKSQISGYKAGQVDALKKFGLWVSIATIAGSFVAWWATK